MKVRQFVHNFLEFYITKLLRMLVYFKFIFSYWEITFPDLVQKLTLHNHINKQHPRKQNTGFWALKDNIVEKLSVTRVVKANAFFLITRNLMKKTLDACSVKKIYFKYILHDLCSRIFYVYSTWRFSANNEYILNVQLRITAW